MARRINIGTRLLFGSHNSAFRHLGKVEQRYRASQTAPVKIRAPLENHGHILDMRIHHHATSLANH